MNTTLKRTTAFILLILLLIGSGCSARKKDEKLGIAVQFGLAYAPLEIMDAKGFLRERLAEFGVEPEFIKLANTANIRESMLAGDVDIGFVAIPPFLLGKDKGMDWRIIAGISESEVGLVARGKVQKDPLELAPGQMVIVPQPGSIQHILLAMYAEREHDDAEYFDKKLVALSHPDGMAALLAGDGNYLHFTAPPYLEAELEIEGSELVLDGKDCFGGEFTFIVGIAPQRTYERREIYNAFRAALFEAIEFMDDEQEAALDILNERYEYSREEIRDYISAGKLKFTTDVVGLEKFADFLWRTGKIDKEIEPGECFWPE